MFTRNYKLPDDDDDDDEVLSHYHSPVQVRILSLEQSADAPTSTAADRSVVPHQRRQPLPPKRRVTRTHTQVTATLATNYDNNCPRIHIRHSCTSQRKSEDAKPNISNDSKTLIERSVIPDLRLTFHLLTY